ncbi:hypothetical protein [Rhodospira trueperi]|uniref:Uncharacterized protein n=1 Tax=Rhodospira trueperi TaxID=69960 RepID=A0A1G7H2R0_9PROT|nr:hypothetical protein [Rhodospira trueperi]SDE94604.1 hypothetical protein SAMN05421720_11732 [Rhodospira trueperi]
MTAPAPSDPEDDIHLPDRFPVLDRLTSVVRRWMVTLWGAAATLMAPGDPWIVGLLLVPTFFLELRWVTRAHDLRVRNVDLLAVLTGSETRPPPRPVLPSRRQALWMGGVLVALFVVASLSLFVGTSNRIGLGAQYALIVLPYSFAGLMISRYMMDLGYTRRYRHLAKMRGKPRASAGPWITELIFFVLCFKKEQKIAGEHYLYISMSFMLFFFQILIFRHIHALDAKLVSFFLVAPPLFLFGCLVLISSHWQAVMDRAIIADRPDSPTTWN